jgi:hypothetical protein
MRKESRLVSQRRSVLDRLQRSRSSWTGVETDGLAAHLLRELDARLQETKRAARSAWHRQKAREGIGGPAASTSDVGRQTPIRGRLHLDHLRQRRNMRLRNVLLIVESHETDEEHVVVFADLQGKHVPHWQREDDALVWI